MSAIESTIAPDRIEYYAIRCAKGNNGGEWASHYTEDQKNVWRKFVSDLVVELGSGEKGESGTEIDRLIVGHPSGGPMTERVLPREFVTPPEFLIPLSNPELQELGTFAAIWSQIDWIILIMVSQLAKIEIGAAVLMMDAMTSGPRVGLLTKLCQDSPENPTKKAVKKVCDDNGGLIEDRNHIIHGLWAIEWDYATDKAKAACLFQKGKRKPIAADKLPALSDRAAKFSNELGKLLEQLNPIFSGDRPRRFYFGAGSPQGRAQPPWPPTPSS